MTFSERNKKRCEAPNGFNHKLDSWSLSDWMTATIGELGEAANIIKKMNRVRDGIPGNTLSAEQLRAELAMELADTAIYLDLMIQAAGFDIVAIRNAKFAITSAKIGYDEFGQDDDPHIPAGHFVKEDLDGERLAKKCPPLLLRCCQCGQLSDDKPGQFLDPDTWVCSQACKNSAIDAQSYNDLAASGGIVDAP